MPSIGVLIVIAEALDTSASKLTIELERLLQEKKPNRGRARSGKDPAK
jgi:hypothetical protein